uniref:DUF4214 domain-containing protein n=1 Tax=uncultured Brevundimonas sp. TaxID=213418 RepID=UPI002594EFA7
IDIAAAFASAAEFQQKYGTLSNADFVAQMYRFTLDREPDAAGLAGWTARLDDGSMSRAEMLLSFSESAEHVRLTAGLWLGGIQVSGGNNGAALAGAAEKTLDAPEAFHDPVVVHDLTDDDAFLLSADIDLDPQVMPALVDPAADVQKPATPDEARDTLPPAWFDTLHGQDARPDLADLHRPAAANDLHQTHQIQDHAWVV